MGKEYVLPFDWFEKLKNIKNDYEKRENVKLKAPLSSSPSSKLPLLTFLGSTDLPTREKQIYFIQKFFNAFKGQLVRCENIHTEEALMNYLEASKLLIAVCLFVQDKIKKTYKNPMHSPKNSDLYDLIDEYLGINSNNKMTVNDKATCYSAALEVLGNRENLKKINLTLKEKCPELGAISDIDMYEFKAFLKNKCASVKNDSYKEKRPVAYHSKIVFGRLSSTLGAAIGLLVGPTVSSSDHCRSARELLSNAIKSGALCIGVGSAFGWPFIAPIAAGNIVKVILQVGLAENLYLGTRKVGEYLGTGIGTPIDVSYHYLNEKYQELLKDEKNSLNGIRLIDGKQVVNGIIVDTDPKLDNNVIKITEIYETHEKIDSKLMNELKEIIVENQKKQIDGEEDTVSKVCGF